MTIAHPFSKPLRLFLLIAAAAFATPVFAQPLPADLNLASLRVSALNTLYEFDLSPEQLKALRLAAAGAASAQTRTAPKPNPALAQAFKDFQTALLAGGDDAAISKLRNHLTELVSDAELDDEVQPTATALAAAPAICHQLKASQIAAFLALHADQVADPGEMIFGALDTIRETHADAAPNAAAEINSLTTETAASAGYLIYGTDDAKSAALAAQVTAWLKAGAALGDKEFTTQQPNLKDTAHKLIGDVDPLLVLSHWLDLQLAQLLSNPELTAAIDAKLAAPPVSK